MLSQASWLENWKQRAGHLKDESHALLCAYRHPGTPWYAKGFAALVVAYAFSPVDLIPDFIPVLGYLDDLLLIPLGISLASKMIPGEVLEACRAEVRQRKETGQPSSALGFAMVVLLWVALAGLVLVWIRARIS